MRNRLRESYSLSVFRYDAQHVTIPEDLWVIARAQQALWNDLVVLAAITAGQAKAEPELKKLHWWAFDFCAKELVQRSGLDWANGPECLDRFRAAMKGIGKDGKGPPKKHFRLERVRIIHRFTGGGIPASKLYSLKGTRISLSEDYEPERWTGIFGLPHVSREGTEKRQMSPVHFRIHEKRRKVLVPQDAIVKRVAWCGELNRPFGWKWSLHVTVEKPPEGRPDAKRPAAGLDIGWHVMAEGAYLRIGVLTDENGNTFEFRLPSDLSNRDTRRAGIPSSWADMRQYDEDRAEKLEVCKAAIAPILERDMPGQISKNLLRLIRDHGLERLAVQVEKQSPEASAVIRAWQAENQKIWRRATALRGRLLRRRRYMYRLLAKWLCERYGTLSIEQDMSLAKLATFDKDMSPAINAAQRHRQIASLSELRLYIEQAAAKTGTIVGGNAAFTTADCAECLAPIEVGPNLVLKCANGHERDQDFNASLRLLSQIDGVDARVDELRRKRRETFAGLSSERADAVIPQQLKAVAVPCSLD